MKSYMVIRFYAQFTDVLRFRIASFGDFEITLIGLLLTVCAAVSGMKLIRIFYSQLVYQRYLKSLPKYETISYRNTFGLIRSIPCFVDPVQKNAFVYGIFRPSIVLPEIELDADSKPLYVECLLKVANHNLNEINMIAPCLTCSHSAHLTKR